MAAPPPSHLDFSQCIQGSYDDANGRLRVDAVVTATISDVIINALESSIAIGDQTTGNLLTVNPDGTIDVNTIINATTDNIQIRDPNSGNNLAINGDGSINIGNFPSSVSVTQGTSPWVVSGTVTANAGTGTFLVDGSANIQPVSGTITANQGTSPWIVSGTVLTSPDVNIHDGSGNSISSTGSSLDVNVTNTVPVSQSGTWNINNISGTISLPTGASTSALQTTGNSSLASIDNQLASHITVNQGTQALPGNAWYVAITDGAATVGITGFSLNTSITNGTGAAAVNIRDGGNSITVDGTVSISNLPTASDTNYGTVGANTLRTAAQIGNAAGAANFGAGVTGGQTLRVVLPTDQTAIPVSQSGTWSVTANAGTNLNTSLLALESGGNLASIKTNTDNLNLTQGSTTSGQKGSLSFGAVTTAAPTYTTGQSNTLSLTTTGALRTDSSGTTQPISGTIAATQSGTWTVQPGNTANTTPWLVTDSSDGPVTPGTVAIKSSLAGGQFNTVLPTLTNGQQAALQVDSSGRLLTTASAVISNDTNYGTVGANTLRTASQIGNSTGAANFGSGVTGNQTLRVVLATDQTVIPVAGNVASAATDSGNPVKVGGIYTTTVPSLTSGQRVDLQTDKNGAVFVNTSGRRKTYSTAVNNLVISLLATDIFTITGAAGVITRIGSIRFSGQSTSNLVVDLNLLKRSTANSGGTSSTLTAVPHDSADGAASATVRSYTANPTLGTLVGIVRASTTQLSGSNSIPSQIISFDFTEDNSKPIVLNSASEVLAFNFLGQSAVGSLFDIDIQWTEE